MTPKTLLIAEVADNHGGDLKLAKEFIRILAAVGVDYVKFQSWQLAKVRDRAAEPMYDWLVKAELTDAAHYELMEECARRGVKFLTTCFDPGRVDFLASLGLTEVKVGSAEVSDHELLARLRARFEHVILSTGMHTGEEVRAAVDILTGGRTTLMHCVSIYPSTPEQANFNRLLWLRRFCGSVGFSDHGGTIEAAKMAIVLGADYVERHTCLGKYGPDRVNPWDTTPEKWEELAKYRDTVAQAWGPGDGPLTETDLKVRARFIGRWLGGQGPLSSR
jgi:sialic acid synthase SpsE